MRIIQAMPAIDYGDAVSNDALAIQRILREAGFSTGIYAEGRGVRLPVGSANSIHRMPYLHDDDIMLYHASTGSKLNGKIRDYGGQLVVWYHNITPAEYFYAYSRKMYRLLETGYGEIAALAPHADYAVADSEFNRKDLIRMGYQCDIDVIPIAIPWDDYDLPDDPEILEKYGKEETRNILFVGRIVPNKKQENLIRAFGVYTYRYQPDARLILCGSDIGLDQYGKHLKEYAKALGLEDKVVFTGHISFQSMLTLYKMSDILLCLSEHEGFCVPVVEAMHFGLPIVAYDSCAVGATMGQGGVRLTTRDPDVIAAAIHRVVEDHSLRDWIRERQKEEMKKYRFPVIRDQILATIQKLI